MANVAIVFAGGTGSRMNSGSTPKQFLEVDGKPILVYTLEVFEHHPEVDGIVVVVLSTWLEYTKELAKRYHLTKVTDILPGGATAIDSQRIGLEAAASRFPSRSVAMIHDGVRPLITEKVVSDNIACVLEHGSAITTAPAIETIVVKDKGGVVGRIIDRSDVELARAPQSFFLEDILAVHRSLQKGESYIDSASMMQAHGHALHTVNGPAENIKITTPNDFFMFKALLGAKDKSDV